MTLALFLTYSSLCKSILRAPQKSVFHCRLDPGVPPSTALLPHSCKVLVKVYTLK